MDGEFTFKRVKKKPFEVGPFTVTAARVDHPVEAFAFRIEHQGKSLVYSGDTAACRQLTELATGADLLLAEAAFRDGEDNPPHIHMTGSEAAATAVEAGVGRLVLTHVPPWHDELDALREAEGVFAGPTTLAAEGSTYELRAGPDSRSAPAGLPTGVPTAGETPLTTRPRAAGAASSGSTSPAVSRCWG